MAENHYVDPVSQIQAAEGIEDHSDLSTMYVQAEQKELGPWMQESERQKVLADERHTVVKKLRRSSILIGLFISIPVDLALIMTYFIFHGVEKSDPNAMPYLIAMLFGAGISFVVTINMYRLVAQRFYTHAVRALPIVITVLLTLALTTENIFTYSTRLVPSVSEPYTLIAGLVGVLVISIITTFLAILLWTTKLTPVFKIVGLLVIIAIAAVIHSFA